MKSGKGNYFYGMGTLGRDMVYAMTSMYLMYYLTDVRALSVKGIGVVTIAMVVLRIFDALNDPFMGYLIDHTQTRFGKFKPWILGGSIVSALATILVFYSPFEAEGPYLVYFILAYLFWGLSYTAHDISYWSMLPSLSKDLATREKIGSIAKICADVGIFTIVIGIVPITTALGQSLGSLQAGYLALATILAIAMVGFLIFMVLVVKEDRSQGPLPESAGLREILQTIFQNDQLLWVVLALVLFTIANTTTTSFGIYYFKYVYGDESIYSLFAAILGLSQLAALMTFPWASKWLGRKRLYGFGTLLVCLGYLAFYWSKSLVLISLSGVLIFFGEGFIQILMLMFISDCVEYGEWKLGRRNDSITLSLQPFIAKMGSAIAAGIVGLTIILTGLKGAQGPQDLTPFSLHLFKFSMLLLPLVIIVIGYLVYRKHYRLDEDTYQKIVKDLERRKHS